MQNVHDVLTTEEGQRAFAHWRLAGLDRLECELEAQLSCALMPPARLHEAVRYAVFGGGKRLRPLLCQASGVALGADRQALDTVGAAVEMVHISSLVYDDLPAMDDDSLRHGRPSVHIQFDEATAILAGSALLTQAFMTLRHTPIPPARQALLMETLARAAGPDGLCGGQMLDLDSLGSVIGLPVLNLMYQMKTGALIRAAVRMGALCAEPSDADLEALDRYATAIGLAFQVVDDILDVTQDSATLGKTAGKDAQDHKPTYVSVFGLDPSRRLARLLNEQAHAALAGFDARATYLRELADQIVNRLH
ncbi:farnesyl diphosphate synthase [Pseudomonas sp. SWRI154]|uniref:polyprenyl synthetase family protein n=1 Tax=Pseudomonas sp. SWRI154 TaxID=2745501 RepID=UPI0016494F96|nr:farnesyl diphosphate synthase [Pseudomonas sp. SWRI154]MBC3363039.1 polyprenyl synthetase family protein [Pseudomonas sp. SWRI154]